MGRNTIELMLIHHFPSYLRIPLSWQRRAVTAVLLYLFRGIKSRELTRRLEDLLGEGISVREFRAELGVQGYILKNIKTWLYYSYVHNAYWTRQQATRTSQEFEVKSRDTELARYLKRSKDLRRALPPYTDRYKALPLRGINAATERVVKEVDIYTRKFVTKKMRFLARSYGIDLEDLVMDLLLRGIQSLLLMYPCVDSRLHSTNIAKRSIHNHGVNLILKHTSKSRNNLIRNDDGTFSSLKVSLDMLRDSLRVVESDDFLVSTLTGSQQSFRDRAFTIEDALTARSLLAGYGGKKRRFLELLTGTHDARFTDWLQEKKMVRKGVTNEQYFERLLGCGRLHRYIRYCLRSLDVPQRTGLAFLQELRVRLS